MLSKADPKSSGAWASVQAELDALAATNTFADGSRKRTTLQLQENADYAAWPPLMLDSGRVTLSGAGLGLTRLHAARGWPAVVVGLPRGKGKVSPVDPSVRVDGLGVLDASVTGGKAGQVTGLRLGSTGLVQLQTGPFVQGWESLGGWTLELKWSGPQAGWIDHCGLGGYKDPSPIHVFSQDGAPRLRYTLSDGRVRQANFPPLAGKTSDLAIGFDAKAGKILGWSGGVQVTVSGESAFPPGLLPAANLKGYPFVIGTSGDDPWGSGNFAGPDWTLWGLLLAGGVRYQDRGPGQPQTTINGMPLNDGYRYGDGPNFNIQAPYLCRFAGLDKDEPRWCRFATSNTDGLVGVYVNGNWNGVADTTIQGLTVAGQPNCQGILISNSLKVRLLALRSTDGWHGIGSHNSVATYPVEMISCELGGSCDGYYGHRQILFADRCQFEGYGRHAVRMAGSNSSWSNWMMADSRPGITRSFFAFPGDGYGGRHLIGYGFANTEGNGVTRAGVEFDLHSLGQSRLAMKEAVLGSLGADIPAVLLTSPAGAILQPDYYSQGSFQLEGDTAWLQGRGQALMADHMWAGTVDGKAWASSPVSPGPVAN